MKQPLTPQAGPEPNPNEFTEREKFILSYYRDPQVCSFRRVLGYDAVTALVAVLCGGLAIAREEMAFAFVGYVLLLGRLYYLVVEGARWAKDFHHIFTKYEARLEALTAAQRGRCGSDDAG